ncbi:hypothetical protein KIS1582_1773 [Cytobacillus firmus]|uniref:Uncharacterized protein n=1 Tax=Cytobacillus firmus TaxID=1399 RepID=A0A800MXT0_CYTFI|nr:hypothetical protein KIS1582_1773 [Cytobacillus firmus]
MPGSWRFSEIVYIGWLFFGTASYIKDANPETFISKRRNCSCH